MNLKNKRILVYGIAKSGIAAVNFLSTKNANIFLYDDNKFVLNGIKNSNLLNCNYNIIFNLTDDVFEYIDLIVISPSVSIYNENIKKAMLLGIKVISELELGFLFKNGDILAVTGTNGKTTTVKLIENIFKIASKNYATLGNIGTPFTEFLTHQKQKTTYITEVSSFQLEASKKFAPFIATILNITPDHMDRHFTMKNYIEEKAKIFKNMKKNAFAILNYDDKKVFELKSQIKSKVFFFSTKKEMEQGIFVKDNEIIFSNNGSQQLILKVDEVPLLGEHNLSNILCAILMCLLYGIDKEAVIKGIKTFKGVPHRLELVAVKKGISYYNDSKATNIDATLKAVNAFKNKIVLILGGSDKGENFDDLFCSLPENVKKLVITGDNKDKIVASAKKFKIKNFVIAKTFEEAVKQASL